MKVQVEHLLICEVGYCDQKNSAFLFSIKLDQGSTIQMLLSVMIDDLPKLDWHVSRLGHRYTSADTVLSEGDRIYLSPKLCQADHQKRRVIRSKKVD